MEEQAMSHQMARWGAPIVVLLALTVSAAWGTLPADPDQEMIVVRGKAMVVWPFEDLRRRGYDIEEIPREDNAYWVYRDAINAFKATPGELRESFDYALSHAWPTGHDEQLKAYMLDADNQKAMSLARRASGMERFQPYYFGDPRGSLISVLLPSLSNYRQLSKMLVVDGRRLAAEGEYEKAFERFEAAMRLGHHQEAGFTLIEGLVAVACWSIGDRGVCDMVVRRELPVEQLKIFVKKLGELDAVRPSTVRGIESERLFGSNVVDEMVTRPAEILRNLHGLSGIVSNGGYWVGTVNKEETPWERFEARVGRLVLPDRTMKKHFDAHYDTLIAMANEPLYSRTWQEFDEEALVFSTPRWNLLARVMLPSLTRACEIGERCKAQSRVTRAAAAIRLFTAENKGQPPADLDALHEWIPAEELIDPFSGKPFVYRRQGRSWVLYSLAENMVDDGGKTGDRPWRLDYVVRYPAPEREPFEPAGAQGE